MNPVLKVIIGVVIGGVGGYAYYRFVGCSSGLCPLTSNPKTSILYGAIVGASIALN